jgi:hypothetical protein
VVRHTCDCSLMSLMQPTMTSLRLPLTTIVHSFATRAAQPLTTHTPGDSRDIRGTGGDSVRHLTKRRMARERCTTGRVAAGLSRRTQIP